MKISKVNIAADGKVHIEDPKGEIKQLGGDPKGKPADSANARAAAMKEAAAGPPGGLQGAPAAHEAAAAKEKAAPAEAPAKAQADGSEWS
jgi:hypothetical protein